LLDIKLKNHWLHRFQVFDRLVFRYPRCSTQQSSKASTLATFAPHVTQKCSVVLQLSATSGSQHSGQNTKNMHPLAAHVFQLGAVVTRVLDSWLQYGHSAIIIGARDTTRSSFWLLPQGLDFGPDAQHCPPPPVFGPAPAPDTQHPPPPPVFRPSDGSKGAVDSIGALGYVASETRVATGNDSIVSAWTYIASVISFFFFPKRPIV